MNLNNILAKIDQLFDITLNVSKAYIKAQLILGCITLIILSIGFIFLDIPLWFLWAFLLMLADFVPIVGVGIFMIPWAIICFIMGNSSLGGWLLLIYCIMLITRQILEPVIMGNKIGLSPILTFAAIIIGAFFGPMGLILAPIVAAVLKAFYLANKKQEQDTFTIKNK